LGAFGDEFVEVVGLLSGEFAHGEVVEDEDCRADEFGEAAGPGAVGVAAGEVGEGSAGFGEADFGATSDGLVAQRLGDVALADADSDGDRLQQIRAVLPCEVRVVAETHPLFGRLLSALSFKRLSGVVHLVVDLPDGSPGTIRADATDVLGEPPARGPLMVLDGEGLRALHALAVRIGARR
jgi:hypothetical protein